MPRKKNFDESELLKDATDLFWRKGYHQTSIQDLVDNLSINRASLYDTYKDKEGLFKRCFVSYRENVNETINKVFNESNTIKKGFQNLFNFIINELCLSQGKRGCLISNTYAELLPTKNQDTILLLEETRQTWLNIIQEKLKKAQINKELKNNININQISDSIYSSITGILILSKTQGNKKTLHNSLSMYLDIFK